MFATITKTAEAQKFGAYKPTAVDAAKYAADIRIIAVDGTFTVDSRIALSGRGIKAYSTAGRYEVSRAALAKLQNTHNVVTDF